MFSKGVMAIPTISEAIEKELIDESIVDKNAVVRSKYKGLSWFELPQYGIVKERIDKSEDIVVVTREFFSKDNTQYISENLVLERSSYDKFMAYTDLKEVEEILVDLELEYDMLYASLGEGEREMIEDQIKFLKGEFQIKDS